MEEEEKKKEEEKTLGCSCKNHLTITFTKNGDFCGNCGKPIR